MTGEEAARIFYVPDRLTRRQAIPMTTLMLLQDWGSVQTLEGDAHRYRKQMFMSLLMTHGRVQQLVDIADQQWRAGIERWQRRRQLVLHDEAREILCRAVCAWAGVPLPEREVAQRAREFGAMIDGSGSIGPRNWRGQMLRRHTERWIQGIIEHIRSGRIAAAPDTAACMIAWHRGTEGQLLRPAKAAVELINVLRPTVAVSRFITFAALAMHEHPFLSHDTQPITSGREA